jgi:dipeptidyl aminopeptidase/acylaminoacyl peptidase
VALSADRSALLYSANTGTTPGDDDRRHVFRVPVAGGPVTALTSGEGLEWTPVGIAGGGAAVIAAGARTAAALAIADGGGLKPLPGQAVTGFAGSDFVVPKPVTFTAPDGLVIHGQLFDAGGAGKRPGVIFVHGGPPRQMLLGFSYMRYYSNAYAMNQYLASRGFVVLSVNFRLGIGYGHDFQHPDRGGPAGASEYQDVLAGARWLQARPQVDPGRIGIWGGSYGGLLTAQALARNSDVFKAGVDIHGVHDWSRVLIEEIGATPTSAGDTDRRAALDIAFKASPVADIAGWKSPVLLIHGDDDRNVRVNQTVDLAQRLAKQGVRFEELIIPNEIHDFLRHAGWMQVDAAAAGFLERELKP